MKIAIFTETWLPQINGVVTHIKTLKDGLENLGHRVLVVTADSTVKRHYISDDVMYCPAVRLKNLYDYDVSSPISVDRMRLIAKFEPDIIHIHNEFGIGISGILISKVLRIPLVYTLHTMYEEYIYYVANKNFGKFVTNASYQYARALAHTTGAIIGPSPKVRNFFKKCGVKKQISVIPNSAELEIFDPEKVAPETARGLREKFGFSESDVVFCFCGRLGKEKNISLLLSFWAGKVRGGDGFKLLIVGGGPYYEIHSEEIDKLGISDTVVLAGRIEHPDLPPYYACCDAYITASQSDTYSISMLEGMAMGLPVIHIKDEINAIIPGVNGYFYNDAEEMYGYMNAFKAMSPGERAEFKRRTRESVMLSGSANLAESILEIYDQVIKEKEKKKNIVKANRENREKLK
ncbi:MAG: glycosyltransferase [Oscillospiraceae bacterium]|jgi:1,2-diacylglycerol 3-alpha-glucosyltransferase|nr:glycosyltransferase [Oscillospiraceae bacterium]